MHHFTSLALAAFLLTACGATPTSDGRWVNAQVVLDASLPDGPTCGEMKGTVETEGRTLTLQVKQNYTFAYEPAGDFFRADAVFTIRASCMTPAGQLTGMWTRKVPTHVPSSRSVWDVSPPDWLGVNVYINSGPCMAGQQSDVEVVVGGYRMCMMEPTS